jgi:hypothetical protein
MLHPIDRDDHRYRDRCLQTKKHIDFAARLFFDPPSPNNKVGHVVVGSLRPCNKKG